MSAEILLDVQDLHVTFGKGKKAFEAVRGVSFQVYRGETFGIVGESGSGKTTIGRAIMRIHPVSGGGIYYKGEQINGKISRELDKKVIKEIQMIFQDPMASLNERAKVDYIVSEGLMNLQRLDEGERAKRVEQALADVGLLPEFASRFPHEFSGGQRQRIGIACAGAESAGGPAENEEHHVYFYRPRLVGDAVFYRPDRGDTQGTDRRAGGDGGADCACRPSLYAGAFVCDPHAGSGARAAEEA